MFKRYLLNLSDLIIGLVEMLLLIRIALKLLGASPTAPFVEWVYATTTPLLAPFEGMFPTSTLPIGSILEASTLFALIAYALFGLILETIIYQLTLASRK